MEHTLSLRLDNLGELVEDVSRLVKPAALDLGLRPELGAGDLKAHGSVAHGKRRGLLKAAGVQVQEYLAPRLRALPESVVYRQSWHLDEEQV